MIVTLKLFDVAATGLPLHLVRRRKIWNDTDILQNRTEIFKDTCQMISGNSVNLELLGVLIA